MKITKLILLISICILFVIIPITSGAIFYFSRNTTKNSITTQQLQLAQQTMDKIDRLLFERYNQIQIIAEHASSSDLFIGKNRYDLRKTQENLAKLNNLSLVTGPWKTIELIDTKGDIVISTERSDIASHSSAFASPTYTILIKKALQGDVAYSDIFWDTSINKPTILFAAPIRDRTNPIKPVVGMALGHLSWPVVLEVLKNIQGSTVELYAASGEKIGDNKLDSTIKIADQPPELKSKIKKTIEQNNFTDTYRSPEQKTEVLATFTKEKGYLTYKGNNWVLGINLPTSQAFALVESTTALAIFGAFLPLTILLVAITYLFIFRLIRPIDSLTETTKQIAAGDLNKRVKVQSTRDEVGQLGTAFNIMTDKLQELYQGLEQKVQEKTVDLAQKVKEIAEQKRVLDSVVHNMPIGVALLDPTSRPIMVNEVGIHLLGKGLDPSTANTGGKVYPLFRANGTPYPVQEIPHILALKKGEPISKDDIVVHHPDETKVAIRFTSVPIKDNQNRIVSIVSVFEDITKERDVDRMKTEFISLASHQLRTPLSAIKWFTEMLLGGDAGALNQEQSEFAKNIGDSTERMIDLVNSLLNISRIESGRIMVDPQPTDLKELVDGIVTELHAKTKEREQSLVVSVHSDLPKINVDPKLIRQVYLNLMTNAIKYTPKGGEISVFISRKGGEIVSQVSDNGYGIPRAQQPKMFQKFFRAENIIKIETDGTGLGLYLIKSIIESSHGRIWFESDEGKGTTFWFSIPISGMAAKKGEVTLDE